LKKLGIIAALPAEAKCFQINELSFETPIEIEKNVFLCISGIGYESSLNATKKLVKLNVDGLISWGIAGAISNSINSGDMVIARSVINHRNIYSTSHEWQKKIISHFKDSSYKIFDGDVVSTEKICASFEEKMKLFRKTKALAIDMESVGIAEIAMASNLDFIIIRAIADNADSNIPEAVIKNIDNFGRINIGRFLASCLFHPAQIYEIILLAKSYKKSLAALTNISTELKKKNFFYSS